MGKSVLFIGPHRPSHDQLNPLWQEMELAAHRFSSTDAAIEILQDGDRPSVVMVSYPLWDSSLDDLLAVMKRTLKEEQRVPVVVLAPADALLEVMPYEDQGIAVVSEGDGPDEMRAKLRALIGGSRRAHPRFIVRMAVRVGDGAVLRACQSENISVSGMLIRTSEEFPVGSQVRLEFALTDADEPMVCLAEVVRYTEPEKEKIRGMGVNFLSFEDDGWSRLEQFLAA